MRFILIFLLLISAFTAYSQQPISQDLLPDKWQATYYYGDSVSKIFYANNLERIGNINRAVFDLPINQCLYEYITVKIYVDPIGMPQDVFVMHGAGNPKLNNLIRKTILNYPGLWETAYFQGETVYFSGLMTFMPSNLATNYNVKHKGADNTVGYVSKLYGISHACEESEYYYNEGVKRFQATDFKGAVKMFKKALDYNNYDVDVIYNLGISNVRLGSLEKACGYFSKGAEYGDPAAEAALKKHCN